MQNDFGDEIIQFLKARNSIYCECPNCGDIFSLRDAKLIWGKEPPKNLISKIIKQRDTALTKAEEIVEEKDDEMQDLISKHDVYSEKKELEISNVMDRLKFWKKNRVDAMRQAYKEQHKKGLEKQLSVKYGHLTETLGFFKGFGLNPFEMHTLNPPTIDCVFFQGETKDKVNEIIFMESKSKKSNLSPTQKSIADCIADGKVRFEVCKPRIPKIEYDRQFWKPSQWRMPPTKT